MVADNHIKTIKPDVNSMPKRSTLSEARSTCEGLQRLLKKIGDAAADIDSGGDSSYEMHALIASANTCMLNLEIQLTLLDAHPEGKPNVVPLKRDIPERALTQDGDLKITRVK